VHLELKPSPVPTLIKYNVPAPVIIVSWPSLGYYIMLIPPEYDHEKDELDMALPFCCVACKWLELPQPLI
jgi:hypothetical protein